MVNYHLNVFLQKVCSSLLYTSPVLIQCYGTTVPTIKNTKLEGDLTSPNNGVCQDTNDNGEHINAASGEKLKEMMKEMNQTLNMLSGSVIAPDSATSQVAATCIAHVNNCIICSIRQK